MIMVMVIMHNISRQVDLQIRIKKRELLISKALQSIFLDFYTFFLFQGNKLSTIFLETRTHNCESLKIIRQLSNQT